MTKLSFASLLLFVSLAGWCATYDEMHDNLLKQNPPGLTLRIQFSKQSFFLGERIPVTLIFENTSTEKYRAWMGTYDRSGRIDDIRFSIDPPEQVTDPLATYFSHGAFMGGGLGNFQSLGNYSQTFDLNEWQRFDAPGKYRVYCTTSRVSDEAHQGKRVSLCSQIVEIEVAAATEKQLADAIQSAQAALKSGDHYSGARVLRFLACPAAIEELVPLLGDADVAGQAMFGIIGARDWAHARQELENGLTAPDIVVTAFYLQALAHVSLKPEQHAVSFDLKDWQAYQKQADQLGAAKKAATQAALRKLAAALPAKRGRARAAACSTLLNGGENTPQLRAALAQNFEALTQNEQFSVLDSRWDSVRCPEFEPVLAKILPPRLEKEQWNDSKVQSLAVLRYLEFQPQKARNIILDDICQPYPMLSGKALCALPDKELPETDDAFRTNLAMKNSDLFKIAPLIERYGTKALLPTVIEFYHKREGYWACTIQEALLRYWMKHDPTEGVAAVERTARLRDHTRCYTMVLGNVFRHAFSPEAEKVALSFLDDEEPDVIVDVLRLLKRVGSEKAIEALLARLAKTDPEDKAVLKGASFSQASVHRELVDCLLERKDWRFTDEQKAQLLKLLKSDLDKKRFDDRFRERP